MGNLNTMSDFQKIIFARGINEKNVEMHELSSNYPFVAFVTDLKVNEGTDKETDISNIWINGKRLTRFVGIDETKNSITINGHHIHLSFDYETGLLGLIDDNSGESYKLYYGYQEEFNYEQLYSIDVQLYTGNILYDWNNDSSPNITDKYFFIAIPRIYEGQIMPRFDVYETINGKKTYYSCTEWFNTEYVRINDIDYIIYRRITTGKFYGKIQ